jgi:hypothetical protein
MDHGVPRSDGCCPIASASQYAKSGTSRIIENACRGGTALLEIFGPELVQAVPIRGLLFCRVNSEDVNIDALKICDQLVLLNLPQHRPDRNLQSSIEIDRTGIAHVRKEHEDIAPARNWAENLGRDDKYPQDIRAGRRCEKAAAPFLPSRDEFSPRCPDPLLEVTFIRIDPA